MKKRSLNPFMRLSTGILSMLILILFDQGTKYLAVTHLREKNSLVLIQGVLELRYLENRGMAFGMMEGKIPVFVGLCLVFFCICIYFYRKVPKTYYYLPLLLTTYLMFAGAAGNFIDRVWRGYVVDYIYFSLIDFPIFNIADIYVVCSGILLVYLVCFRYKDEDFFFLKQSR